MICKGDEKHECVFVETGKDKYQAKPPVLEKYKIMSLGRKLCLRVCLFEGLCLQFGRTGQQCICNPRQPGLAQLLTGGPVAVLCSTTSWAGRHSFQSNDGSCQSACQSYTGSSCKRSHGHALVHVLHLSYLIIYFYSTNKAHKRYATEFRIGYRLRRATFSFLLNTNLYCALNEKFRSTRYPKCIFS